MKRFSPRVFLQLLLLEAMAKLGHHQESIEFIRRYWGDTLRPNENESN